MTRANKLQEAQSFLQANSSRNMGGMRPFIGKDGIAYVLNHTGGDPKDPKNFKKIQVNAASLRYDEWRKLDEAVIKIAEQRLIGFDDLRRNGLVYPLMNAMGTTVLTWETMSDAMEAFVSINPARKGNNDTVVYETKHIPIPIVHADYTIGERILQESRNRGNGLDVTNAERAARKVSEQLEDMLFGAAATLTYGGGTIHSYMSFPDKTLVPWGGASNYWTDATKTAVKIKDDVLAMKQASLDDRHYGPWMLYVSPNYEGILDNDYSVSGASNMTIRERILKIEGIQGIRVVDRLAAHNVLLVQMSKDTVDLIDGMPMQNVEWNSDGGFTHNYKVMTIQVPRIKSDANNRSGIVHLGT